MSLLSPLLGLLVIAGPPSALSRWDGLEKGVRDGHIPPATARTTLAEVVAALATRWPTAPAPRWTFPIEGGDVRWIGGTRGEGFHPRSPRPAYTWYDGNRHGGHPAHDVFIPDRDRDCRHDRTDAPFPALAMQPAVVVSTNLAWEPGNPRGGRYVWLFQGATRRFFYYAHLDEVAVRPGDVVRAGDRLGTVGRTGFRRGREHKSCHIHLMVLDWDDGRMTPYDYFGDLGGSGR